MRKVLIALATAGAAIAFATPASAQYYPQPAYGAPYGNAYGYNNWGQTRAFQARLDAIKSQISQLDRRNVLRNWEARQLRAEARSIEQRMRYNSRNGLSSYEMNGVAANIARLEQHVQQAAYGRYGNRGYGYNSYNSGYYDRDRDGRDDRYEDDHGYRRD